MRTKVNSFHQGNDQISSETERILQEIAHSPPLSIGVLGLYNSGKSLTIQRMFKISEYSNRRTTTSAWDISLFLGKYYKLNLRVLEKHETLEDDTISTKEWMNSLQNYDVLLWILDAVASNDSLEKYYLTEICKYHKNIVIGLNKIDLIAPGDWNEYYYIPSRQQERNIHKLIEYKSHTLSSIDMLDLQIFPYSARYYTGLPNFLTAIVNAVPDDRTWKLGLLNEANKQSIFTDYLYSDIDTTIV